MIKPIIKKALHDMVIRPRWWAKPLGLWLFICTAALLLPVVVIMYGFRYGEK